MAKEKYTRINPRNINKERIYMLMDKADMLEAMKVMPDRTFKVFMYLMSNQDGWSSNHARKAVSDNTGYDKSTVSKIFKQLKELGYIVEVDDTEIIYSYSTTKGRPAAYTEPHIAGVNNWTEADKEKYGKKVVKASCSTVNHDDDDDGCSTVNHDDDDGSCSTVNHDSVEVAPQPTSSCSTAHTNTTNNTSTNTTVEADANAAEEKDNVVTPESTTASSIDDAASEDAEASSGMSEQELRDYFKSQGDIRKVFVKDTLKPWLKYGDGYTSNLTCLELWWKVKDNYEYLGRGSLKCDYQSLAVTYDLWKRAIVAKKKAKEEEEEEE